MYMVESFLDVNLSLLLEQIQQWPYYINILIAWWRLLCKCMEI